MCAHVLFPNGFLFGTSERFVRNFRTGLNGNRPENPNGPFGKTVRIRTVLIGSICSEVVLCWLLEAVNPCPHILLSSTRHSHHCKLPTRLHVPGHFRLVGRTQGEKAAQKRGQASRSGAARAAAAAAARCCCCCDRQPCRPAASAASGGRCPSAAAAAAATIDASCSRVSFVVLVWRLALGIFVRVVVGLRVECRSATTTDGRRGLWDRCHITVRDSSTSTNTSI